jgi:hypothetical protein
MNKTDIELKISHLTRHLRLYQSLQKEGFNRTNQIIEIEEKIKKLEKRLK